VVNAKSAFPLEGSRIVPSFARNPATLFANGKKIDLFLVPHQSLNLIYISHSLLSEHHP
jgi:hypothetical protein